MIAELMDELWKKKRMARVAASSSSSVVAWGKQTCAILRVGPRAQRFLIPGAIASEQQHLRRACTRAR